MPKAKKAQSPSEKKMYAVVQKALARWLQGTGRKELIKDMPQLGMTRGQLKKAFRKVSGKQWKDLVAERKQARKSKKEGLQRAA